MATVNIHAAKTQFSALVERAAHGEDIVIARAGEPVARLTAITHAPSAPRVLGGLAGTAIIPDDFEKD